MCISSLIQYHYPNLFNFVGLRCFAKRRVQVFAEQFGPFRDSKFVILLFKYFVGLKKIGITCPYCSAVTSASVKGTINVMAMKATSECRCSNSIAGRGETPRCPHSQAIRDEKHCSSSHFVIIFCIVTRPSAEAKCLAVFEQASFPSR